MDTSKWIIWLVVALAVIVALPILTILGMMLIGGTMGGATMGGGMMGSGGATGPMFAFGLLWALAAVGLVIFLVALLINAARRSGQSGSGPVDQPSQR